MLRLWEIMEEEEEAEEEATLTEDIDINLPVSLISYD